MRSILPLAVLASFLVGSLPTDSSAQTREEKVRSDKERVEADGFWIYNDMATAKAEAQKTGKPILVNFRCIPCTECVKLDDELVDADPKIRPLLEKFVRVRVVATNGLDLDTFQFDTDQSFSVFFLNADGVVYGRFGTRSHRTEWFGDVSLPGMAAAMQGALMLHANYPDNRNLLESKQATPMPFEAPEKISSLTERYTGKLNYEGDVVKSCIHCHQIGDAMREHYRAETGTIPDQWLSPYPHPKSLGLIMDPDTRGTVKAVEPDSIAAEAGLLSGDRIIFVNEQPILSIADIQWALHRVPDETAQTVQIDGFRGGQPLKIGLGLPAGWRDLDDISWRASSWPMRRMVTGGVVLDPLDDEQRDKLQISPGEMALRAKHVGQYGPHAAAKRAGVRKDDILVSYDGRTDLLTDSQVLRYGIRNKKVGERVEIKMLRNGQPKTFTIPIQK